MKIIKASLLLACLAATSQLALAQSPSDGLRTTHTLGPPPLVKVNMQQAFAVFCKISEKKCSDYHAIGIELIRSAKDLDDAAHLTQEEKVHIKKSDFFKQFPVWLFVLRLQPVPSMRGTSSLYVVDATTGKVVDSGALH
jgi:hypothetical protein